MRFLQLSFLIVAFFAAFVLSHKDSSSSESDESHEHAYKPKCSVVETFKCTEERTCDNLYPGLLKKCSCVCKYGMVRMHGECVLKEKCNESRMRRSPPASTECKDPNEQYLYCGSKCPARCGDKPGSRVCTTDCVKGCFCKKGFVLNSRNKCVSPGKC